MTHRSFFIALMLGLFMSGPAMAIEEPKYNVLLTEGAFELRQYAPMLIAETAAQGDMDEASNKGFRLIADFIFGNNQTASATASEKIAMTAPVTVEPQSPDANMQTAQQWRIHFVMPSQYTLASIPQPKNNAVKLREIPGKYFVVFQYSGFNTLARVQAKTHETLQWVQQQGLKAIGTPQLSRYNPPWTLPMFRRNEIMVEVSAPPTRLNGQP